MDCGFIRAACVTPELRVADCDYNSRQIIKLAKESEKAGAALAVFPELCITGYTCADLFLQQTLLDEAENSLMRIAEETSALDMLIILGLPVRYGVGLYNCAAVLYRGDILGITAKQFLPSYAEFYETRYFTACKGTERIQFAGKSIPFGCGIIFKCRNMPAFAVGVEICEDLWTPNPPSASLAAAGACIIANPGASAEIAGKAQYRRLLAMSQSARLISAYLYSGAGRGESSQDLVYAGHSIICENGHLLSQSELFGTGIIYADIDVERLSSERRRMNTFALQEHDAAVTVLFDMQLRSVDLRRHIDKTPFVPNEPDERSLRCAEILSLQSAGLEQRLRHIGAKNVVLGLSGGLDSALALIVAVRAFDSLGLDRKGIQAVSMPCFGTTSRTRSNAELLAKAYGASFKEIDITQAVRRHFLDIGHDEAVHDVTYENSQARERTQVLMDIANQTGGIVIGTGDLSELALGWATYNGDHMSMYAVNSSVPKTLVRHLVNYEALSRAGELGSILLDILDTPVSPELLPPEGDKIAQKTEGLIGPYELHDFFLYYMVRYGFSPKKIHRLAGYAFGAEYEDAEIKKWLIIFIKRFFTQQFKRSCMPDGPKVGSVSLSPRGDFRMPSDASYFLWLKEAEKL